MGDLASTSPSAVGDLVAFDLETLPLGPDSVAPRPICLSFKRAGRPPTLVVGGLAIKDAAEDILSRPCAAHNARFDLAVLFFHYPSLRPLIFEALDSGRVHDTLIREKLFYLGFHGDMDFLHGVKLKYGLDSLVRRRTGLVMTGKEGDGIWRTRYAELENVPVREWPQEAVDYVKFDAQACWEVWQDQEKKHKQFFKTEELHVKASFSLYLMTVQGLTVDHDKLREIEEFYLERLEPKHYPLLYAEEIILPAQPPRPYSNGAKNHRTGCPRKGCACPVKMKAAVPEKLNKKDGLEPYVARLAKRHGIELTPTPAGNVPTGKEVIQELRGLDPAMEEYFQRSKILKLKTSYFPKHYWQGEPVTTIHPNYNPLMKTGRVSSSGGDLYPSLNIQQADPRIRPIYVPRTGLFAGADYSSIDLVCLAQTILDLYGKSTLADQINAGINPHTFLGSVLARDQDPEFSAECQGLSRHESYELFLAAKDTKPEWFRYWRTFAKPVGLGFPGGLGPRTMVSFSKGYGISMTEEQARYYRDLWFSVYPEMRMYLKHWVPAQEYPSGYRYTSPLGMIRSGCTYTECANGRALQTPAAEGMKEATYLVTRACYAEPESVLYGCVPVVNMHDELLLEVSDDLDLAHEQAWELSRLMEEGMCRVITDVLVKAEPVLMKRWHKKAEMVTDENGKLIPWTP